MAANMRKKFLWKMPCFNGVIREIPNISVDNFDNLNATTYFLSHCHADHLSGLSTEKFRHHIKQNDNYLFCTPLTKCILENTYFYCISERVMVLQCGQGYMIPVPSKNNAKDVSKLCVNLIPTGHCPGAVMFLFESDGTESPILYTGDFRLCKSDVTKLSQLHQANGIPKAIYKVYLDTTFVDDRHRRFPLRAESIDAVCRIIAYYFNDEKNKTTMFCIEKPAWFGSETLLVEIAKSFNTKIHVEEAAYLIYMQIPEISSYVTNDPENTRIHACGKKFATNSEMACFLPCRNAWLKSKIIRPSCLWFDADRYNNSLESIIKEENDQIHIRVCYASHCSREELEYFIKYLKPRKMEPIATPKEKTKEQVMEWFLKITEPAKNDDHMKVLDDESYLMPCENEKENKESSPSICEPSISQESKTASSKSIFGPLGGTSRAEDICFTQIQRMVSRDLVSGKEDNKELLDELAFEVTQLQSSSYSKSLSADFIYNSTTPIEYGESAAKIHVQRKLSVVHTDSSTYTEKPQFDEKSSHKRSRKLKPPEIEALDSALESFMPAPYPKLAVNLEDVDRDAASAYAMSEDEKEMTNLCTDFKKIS